MFQWLWWVPCLPLLGFLILVLGGRALSRFWVPWIGAGSVGLAALLTLLIAFQFWRGTVPVHVLTLWTWMAVADLQLQFSLYLDALAVVMMLVVTGVGFLIHVYSAGFMREDPGYARFFAYMNLFVAAMLILVLADNLPLLYLGWEGVGLCSYLLIGFWYETPANGYAARKAFVVTRVGDTAMALGLFLLFTELGSLNIQELLTRAGEHWGSGSLLPTLAAALLLGGALGKSAQLPLQTWLPDAMAGPTPISALIHAATMVTAGVYLIARTHPLFILAPDVQLAVAWIGAVTLLMAGCSALMQTDIKRILAYSTISQIGYMFLALGVGAWSAAIFHLLTHAFFKALLFLAAGAVIMCMHHEHNIFRMGGLRRSLPISFWCFAIGTAALVALPPTSGYYSKHEILLAAYGTDVSGLWLWGLGTAGAALTGVYSLRLLFVVFWGERSEPVEERIDLSMTVPLLLLCALALGGGLLKPPLEGVFPLAGEEHAAGFWVKAVTGLAPWLGILAAVLFYLSRIVAPEALLRSPVGRSLQRFWFAGWGMDALYDAVLVRPFKALAAFNAADCVDRVYAAIVWLLQLLHRISSRSQNGRLRWYAAGMAGGLVLILALGIWQ